MDDLIATVVCGAALVGLAGLLAVAAWESAKRGNQDGYRTLQSQYRELAALLSTVERQRDGLACRVNELERYHVGVWHKIQELDARDRQRAALQQENRDLRQRLAVARVLILAIAARAGVQVDQNGEWRVM